MERFGVGESFGKPFVIGRRSGAPPWNVTVRFTEKKGERYTLIRGYESKDASIYIVKRRRVLKTKRQVEGRQVCCKPV